MHPLTPPATRPACAVFPYHLQTSRKVRGGATEDTKVVGAGQRLAPQVANIEGIESLDLVTPLVAGENGPVSRGLGSPHGTPTVDESSMESVPEGSAWCQGSEKTPGGWLGCSRASGTGGSACAAYMRA